MSWYDVETAVVKVVKAAFPDLKVIKGYSNGPEPDTPYAWIDLISLDPVGQEEIGTLSTDGSLHVVTHYMGRCRVVFVGKDNAENHGGNYASEFSEALAKPSILEELESQKLSLFSKGTVKRIPKLRETQWYNTYVVEIVIGYQTTYSDINDGITTVTMSGDYISGEDSITQEITISE